MAQCNAAKLRDALDSLKGSHETTIASQSRRYTGNFLWRVCRTGRQRIFF
jgi:hypothetical protein